MVVDGIFIIILINVDGEEENEFFNVFGEDGILLGIIVVIDV